MPWAIDLSVDYSLSTYSRITKLSTNWPYPGKWCKKRLSSNWDCSDKLSWILSIKWICSDNWYLVLSNNWSFPDNWFWRLSINWNRPNNWFQRLSTHHLDMSEQFMFGVVKLLELSRQMLSETAHWYWNCAAKWFHGRLLIGIGWTVDFEWFTWLGLVAATALFGGDCPLIGIVRTTINSFGNDPLIGIVMTMEFKRALSFESRQILVELHFIWSVHNNTILVWPLQQDRGPPCIPNNLQGCRCCIMPCYE